MARFFGLSPAPFATGRRAYGVTQRPCNGLLQSGANRAGLSHLAAGSACGSSKSQQHTEMHENLLQDQVSAWQGAAEIAAAAAMQSRLLPGLPALLPLAQAGAAAALGIIWLLARPAPATAAAVLPRSAGVAQLETMVVIAPEAAAVGSVRTSSNDSMLLIVAVCLGFWMLSATISAGIGAIMKMSGRSIRYGTRGAASWTSAGIMDTFDIMRLPLAYEIDEPSRSSKGSSSSGGGGGGGIMYVPWDGPEASYIPVNMVKVLRPGFREAGLVAKPSMLQPEKSLSIISVETGSRSKDSAADPAPGLPLNGNGHKSNGSNGRTSSSGNTDKGPPSSSS